MRITRGIFQGDSLSTVLFVLALAPMSLVLREVKAGYQLEDLRGKVNHLLFMNGLKLYRQCKKQIDTLIDTMRILNDGIGIEFGISNCATLIMKRSTISKSQSIQLQIDEFIKNAEDGEG